MGIPVWVEREHDIFAEPSSKKVEIDQIEVDQNKVIHPVNDSIPKQSVATKPVEQLKETNLKETRSKETYIAPKDVLKRSELPEDWSGLIDHVAACTRCELHQARTQTVFGVGNTEADWMIVGEAPGNDEDKKGEPFVGPAGDLLTLILESIGLSRDKVYIANTLKCKTVGNRDPKPKEAAQCRAYLDQQIALVNPKIILCVGRIAAQNLLGSQDPLSRIRGKAHHLIHPAKPEKNIPVIATYHPAYLLRSPSQKRKVWDDLQMAYSVLQQTS